MTGNPITVRLIFICALLFFLNTAYGIIGGELAGNPPDSPALRVDANVATSPWSGVGSIIIGKSVFSGVLISPRHVLTAAHVVESRSRKDVTFNLNKTASSPQSFAVVEIFIHPDYKNLIASKDGINHNDLAILELAEAVPVETPIYRISPQPVNVGAIITFVGYGAGGDGINGVTVKSDLANKRIGMNRVEQLLPTNASLDKKEVYLFRFDGPAQKNDSSGTLGNNIEASLAPGDSGSPVFVKIPLGGWHLIGVSTFVMHLPGAPQNRQLFGNGGGGILLYTHLAWIARIIKIPLQ